MPDVPDSVAVQLVKAILAHGVDGMGPMSSSEELAKQYLADSTYKDIDARVDACIRWEAAKNFGAGFATGMGGLLTLPIAIPTSLYATWFVQARLAGAIATMYGYPTSDERVRTFILLALIGDAGKEVLKQAGVQVGNKVAMKAVSALPGRVLIAINKAVGFRLVTKMGHTGVFNLVKAVPIAGGVVGGGVDAAACVAAGNAARALFARSEAEEQGGAEPAPA